jgi:hypothetical protein
MRHFGKMTARVLVSTAVAAMALTTAGCLSKQPSFGEEHPRDYVQAKQNTPKSPFKTADSK